MRSRIVITDGTALARGETPVLRYVDYRDDGVYTEQWPDGHKTTTVLSTPKFAVLLELSFEAFCDRYFREALLSCASALDSYLDWHIDVLLRAAKCPADHRQKLLKEISRQAERRIGSFLLAETSIRRAEPAYIGNKKVELRNNVVHKGYFPEEQEVVDYIKEVLAFMVPKYRQLSKDHNRETHEIFFDLVRGLPPPENRQISHTSLAWRTAVDHLAFQQPGDAQNFEEYVAYLRRRKADPRLNQGYQ